jgi:hypothetical protein
MVAKICTRWKDEEADISSCLITFRKRQDNGAESRSSRLHSMDNCVWKRLRDYCKTDTPINERIEGSICM